MKVLAAIAVGAIVLLVSGALLLRSAGRGAFGTPMLAGEVSTAALPAASLADRAGRVRAAARALHVSAPKQILFGDLHVHSSFSMDAFQLTLPTGGGEGVHPVADACDFARYCSNLDFWSINDHAASLTPRRWAETVEAVRQCDAVSAAAPEPDLTSFLGWEWTQMGSTPENHYGHKNVILRDLEADAIPTRPIAAAPPPGVPSAFDTGNGGTLALGLGAFMMEGGHDMLLALSELASTDACPDGVPVRDLPSDCRESAATPAELFAKLDDWDLASMVIPHGTTWGMYTPPGSSFAKQLTPGQHDPDRQRLVEVYSGHGNAEEYRSYRAVAFEADGTRQCPEPGSGYLPSCWRAGELIRDRCHAEGNAPDECERRAEIARQNFVDADRNAGPWTVPGVTPRDWQDAGQCRDCFQPAFNFRPLGSVQYMLSLARPSLASEASRFRFGFIASSDNHLARAGTGFKELERREFTDARMGEVGRSSLVTRYRRPPAPRSERFVPEDRLPSVSFLETERGGSFFVTGGLAAVHAASRHRADIWDALDRRETYGTSGPRILLWFDLLDPNAPGGSWPMGSEVSIAGVPTFRARAAGSFEPKSGCATPTTQALSPERLAALCRGECHHPSDSRRPITRIEVVRIRPQQSVDEAVGALIEDPWRILECPGDPNGCQVVFSDPEFASVARDASYYVRAIEATSPGVGADPLGCQRDDAGRCVRLDPCFDRDDDDDCTSPTEQRAWSSPIFVDYTDPPHSNQRRHSGVRLRRQAAS